MKVQMTTEMKKLNRARKICAVISLAITIFLSIGFYNQSWNTAETFTEKIIMFGLSITLIVFVIGGFLPGFLHTESFRKGIRGICIIPILGLMIYISLVYTIACMIGWAFLIADMFCVITGKPALSKAEMKQIAETDPEFTMEEMETDLAEVREAELQILREENKRLKEQQKQAQQQKSVQSQSQMQKQEKRAVEEEEEIIEVPMPENAYTRIISKKEYERRVKLAQERARKAMEKKVFDENTDNLWDALEYLMDAVREVKTKAAAQSELQAVADVLEESTSQLAWMSVLSLEQIKKMISLTDIVREELELVEPSVNRDESLLKKIHSQVVMLTNHFEHFNHTGEEMEAIFTDCIRDNNIMQYDFAEIEGHQILYSRRYAFDPEEAEKQKSLVIFAFLRNGEMCSFSHIEDMNEQLKSGSDYITKEKLEKNRGDVLEEMESYFCDTPESKGIFLFRSMHSNLVKWHSERSKK